MGPQKSFLRIAAMICFGMAMIVLFGQLTSYPHPDDPLPIAEIASRVGWALPVPVVLLIAAAILWIVGKPKRESAIEAEIS